MQESPIDAPAVGPAGLCRLALRESLVVIPCSGSKRWGGGSVERNGDSILDLLPSDLADTLRARRACNAPITQLDESEFLPAVKRYKGHLYQGAGTALDTLAQSSAGVLIVSGGYGVVCAAEPVGWYSQLFKPGMWPDGLIGRCIAAYAAAVGAGTVVGLFSMSTAYARVFRGTSWPDSVKQAFLVSPLAQANDGAVSKVPRAQGEALKEISRCEHLPARWTSSDGLRVQVTQLK